MNAEVELESFLVLQNEIGFDGKILRIVGVDDRKLAPLEDCTKDLSNRRKKRRSKLTRLLSLDTQEEQMRELGDVDGADATVAKEAGPVVLEVLVEDAVANVVR